MKKFTIDELNAIKPKNSRLTAFSYGIDKKCTDGVRSTVICWCDCGRTKKTLVKFFKAGNVTNCGNVNCKITSLTHGFTKKNTKRHPLYGVWSVMKSRCYAKSNAKYPRYGARGITMCDEWLNDFKVFFEWAITNGWEIGLKIDRINNNGNYEPQNCRFVNNKISSENRECTIWIEHDGKKLTVTEWAKLLGIKSHTIRIRLHNKWEISKVLNPYPFKPFGYIKNK